MEIKLVETNKGEERMYYKIILYVVFPVIVWAIPLVITMKIGKGDHRFYFRKLLFPYWYLQQRLFEKISHNVRIVCRILQGISLFINYFIWMMIIGILTAFSMNPTHYESFGMVMMWYLILGTILYLFQPKKGKIYETK